MSATITTTQTSHFDEDSSDDDDDDLLLKPQLRVSSITKSTKSSSSCDDESSSTPKGLSQSDASASTANASTHKLTLSSEQLEEKALKDAKFYVDFKLSMDYKVITTASMLKWFSFKPKRTHRDGRKATKSSRGGAAIATATFVPCLVCPNVDEAMAGWHDSVKLTSKQNTLVRFLGRYYTHSNKLQAVDASQLRNYDDNGEHAHETDEGVTFTPARWSSSKMKAHLKSLHGQKCWGEDNRELKLRTEELILVLILQAAQTADEQQKTSATCEPPAIEELEHENTDNHHDETICPAESPPQSPRPLAPPVVVTESESGGLHAAAPRPVDTAKPRLRAGDIIEYYPPHLVAHGENVEQATVLNCYPGKGSNGITLHLANGTFLPRDHQVRILQRYVKGEYQNIASTSRFVSLRKCVIDSKNNGIIHATSLADHVGSLYTNLREEAAMCRTGDEPVTAVVGTGETTAAGPVPTVTTPPLPCKALPKLVSEATGAPDEKVRATRDVPENIQQPSKSRVRKAATTEPPGKSTEWKPLLQRMLDECTESRKRRRADYCHIETCETALETAMAVRQRLDQVAVNKQTDDHWDHWQDIMDCSRERLWDFLTGNRRNLIPAESVRDMSAKFKAWLDVGQSIIKK